MTDDGAPDHGDLVADPARPRRPRTWPERFAIVATFGTAALCLLTAFALVSVYLVVRQKNVVELDVPAAVAAQRTATRIEVTDVTEIPVHPTSTPTPTAATTSTATTGPSTSGAPAMAADSTTSSSTTTLPRATTATPRPTSTPRPTAVTPSTPAAPATTDRTTLPTTTTTAARPTTPSVAPAAAATTAAGQPAAEPTGTPTATPTGSPTATPAVTPSRTPAAVPTTEPAAASDTAFPPADPAAKNFLITGADNGACIDPSSPYAAAFGDRDDLGERSDTIMVVRVDPRADRVAVLSFPRDLWVEIAGSGGSMRRINSAYQRNEPQRLVDTIYNEFGISVDHYIQFDFCAFKTLVDAVGGVDVPFEHPARDARTGLLIETAGCVNLDGEAALAYVRSRYFEYQTSSGEWQRDRSSDLGRISRQQDFIRRTLATVSAKGLMNPDVVRGMLRAADRYIVTDRQLTPKKVLEFAGVMRNVDPDSIMTYQIAATPRKVSGNDVLIPDLDGPLMRDVLALFRGELSLGDAPPEATAVASLPVTIPLAATNDDATAPDADTSPEAGPSSVLVGSSTPDGTAEPAQTTSTVGNTAPVQEVIGIVPPADLRC